MTNLIIRQEVENDWLGIHSLTEAAFRGKPYAAGDEQDVITRLRTHDVLTLSLVAIDAGELVGQVTFSPAVNSDGSPDWVALGPVAVLPSRQGEGIGAKLILEGLKTLSTNGAPGCILTGNPDYYRRFGFELLPECAPANEPAEYFMLKLLNGKAPAGEFSFHRLFYGDT